MEIERKFLPSTDVSSLLWTDKVTISDTYISKHLRIRHRSDKPNYIVTYKGDGTLQREEVEWEIMCDPELSILPLIKTRITVPYMHQKFEINFFKDIQYLGEQLVLIEIELDSKNQKVHLPEWVGTEVTDDDRFYGYNLANLLRYTDFTVK